MESEAFQLGPSSSWKNKESEKSSIWLISCEGNYRHLCGLFCLFPWLKSWLMSEPERYLKEVPYPYSMHVLSPLNGQMQGFSWLDDDTQRPKHGKKEGFVTSCLCLLSPKTGYRSDWTPALVMVSVALMATASKQCVSSQVLQGKKYLSAVPLDPLIPLRDFSWLFKPSSDLVNYFKDAPMPTREQSQGLGMPLVWDWAVYSLLVIYLFSSTKLNRNKVQYCKAM